MDNDQVVAGNEELVVAGEAGTVPMLNLSGAYNQSSIVSGGYSYISKFITLKSEG